MNLSLNHKTKSIKKTKKGININVFQEEDEDVIVNESHQDEPRGVLAVNQAIQQEQDALRERAKRELERQQQRSEADRLFDYDAHYDSELQKQQEQKAIDETSDEKESKYMSQILQAAKERERERDIIRERKIRREQQQEEEQDVTLRGKEQFVTASYKRKLQERNLWLEQDAKRQKEEAEKDVTKQKAGVAGGGLVGFYGNLNRNVALGGGRYETKHDQTETVKEDYTPEALGFSDGFERAADASLVPEQDATLPAPLKPIVDDSEDVDARRLRQRQQREEKVARALERYFQRHPEMAST